MARSMWLPKGAHTDLNIEHRPAPGTGPYMPGAGLGMLWHITVSPWYAIDPMIRVLLDKGAYPQLVVGGRAGFKFPVVAQMLPLDQWGKALAHPSGTPETNRAGWVQVEICASVGNGIRAGDDAGTGLFHMPGLELPADVMRAAAKAENGSDKHRAAVLKDVHLCMEQDGELARAFHSGVAAWTDDTYKALANLALWVHHRLDIPVRCARTFQNTDRFSPGAFITAKGHCGHMHAPNNSHYDPTTAFKGKHLMGLIKNAPHEL